MVIVECPVTGCDYENSPASVAAHISGKKDDRHDWEELDFTGAWDFRNSFSDEGAQSASILHMTDSHIGKDTGGFYGAGWEVECSKGFELAVKKALELDVNAVFHTGDLFHNDKRGITEAQASLVESHLALLNDENIRFYYILGDHERGLGEDVMSAYESNGLARNLSQTPVEIGDTFALYGQNYQSRDHWTPSNWNPDPCGNRVSILGLHQSIAPYTGRSLPDVHVDDIGQWTVNSTAFHFDVIALGQLHKEFDKKRRGTRVICGGATERLGKTRQSISGSVGLFRGASGEYTYKRIHL